MLKSSILLRLNLDNCSGEKGNYEKMFSFGLAAREDAEPPRNLLEQSYASLRSLLNPALTLLL